MSFRKKPITGIFLVLLVLISLPFALQLILQSYLTSAIYQVEQELEKASNNTYQFKFSTIRVNIFRSAIQVSEFVASANDSVRNKSVFKTNGLKVKGIGMISLFLRKKIAIDQILVDDAEIFIRLGENNDKEEAGKFVNPYELFKKRLQSVFVKEIKIHNAKIHYYQQLNDSLPSLVSEESAVVLENLLIDSVTTYTYKRWFDADRFLIISSNFKYITKDSLYTFRFSQLSISYHDSILEIDSVKMIPNYSEHEFDHKAGEQTDRIYAGSDKIVLHGLHVKSLLEKRKIIAATASINHLQLTAFRNKNSKRTERRIPTLQEVIKKIPTYLKIDSIHLNDSKITYKEIAPGSTSAGVVFFSNLSGTIYNFTNDSLLKQHDLHIKAKAKLMGHGNMNATIIFPYLENGTFSMVGHLGVMEMKEFNQVLEKNASVYIDNGTIKEVNFNFEAGLKRAKGQMVFKYNNLHIHLLDKETKQDNAIKERLTTFIANNFIVINNNPGKNETLRKAKLFYDRNPNRFIFNYTWKTLLSGIKVTIGLNEEKVKR